MTEDDLKLDLLDVEVSAICKVYLTGHSGYDIRAPFEHHQDPTSSRGIRRYFNIYEGGVMGA